LNEEGKIMKLLREMLLFLAIAGWFIPLLMIYQLIKETGFELNKVIILLLISYISTVFGGYILNKIDKDKDIKLGDEKSDDIEDLIGFVFLIILYLILGINFLVFSKVVWFITFKKIELIKNEEIVKEN
jgi:hypothetical protein